MATAKKTGIVTKVKDAITGMFSTDAPKGTVVKKAAVAKKAVKATAEKAAKAVKKVAKKVGATAKKVEAKAKKVVAPAKKAAKKTVKKAAKKAVKKASAKRAAPAKRSAPATSMDRKLISLSQPHEVRDWCKSLGCTEAELRAAVAAVGNSAEKVRAHLGR